MAKNSKIQKIVCFLILLLILSSINLHSQKREEASNLYEMQDETLYKGPVHRFFSRYNDEDDYRYLLLLIIPVFFIMIILPFIPALKELIQKKDAEPLYVNMSYSKDPRFFDRSFRQKLLSNVQNVGTDRAFRVSLSKNEEIVEVCKAENVNDYNFGNNLLYLEGNADITKNMRFTKEVYVTGTTQLNENTIIRSILSEKDLKVAPNSTIVRWAGSEANIFVGHDCDLGVRCSCEKELWIDIDCKFKSLYGHPIYTRYDENVVQMKLKQAEENDEVEEEREKPKYKKENIIEFNRKKYFLKDGETDNPEDEPEEDSPFKDSEEISKQKETDIEPEDEELIQISDSCIVVNEKGLVTIDKDSDIDNDIIIKTKALFRKGNKVHGTIKCYKDLELEDNIIVLGNVISEKNIKIGKNCKIFGSIFSQGEVELGENTVIGSKGKDKSVIGKHGIILKRNVKIHGYLLTEGEGHTV
ncbi:MAG: hypothetical protein K9N09_11425 [Candidatus Cloacimonetes bacterium]|nr:hypothetical protein [Candidatus Cloacimonadota bacterium]MCF7869294.1 hypothetical protein [Candidatus Cloacimonadota bacterium]MCF7884716.1 hypothetical protein [Candidatus Cloacimonadota bacterium]